MEKLPENITVCNLECIILPNGEILCNGKRIGYFKDLGKYLIIKTNEVKNNMDNKRIVIIEDWALVNRNQNPYSAPELAIPALQGRVYGHKNFSDGTQVTTSKIQGKKDGMVVTHNTYYKLGKPSEDFVLAMQSTASEITERTLSNLKEVES